MITGAESLVLDQGWLAQKASSINVSGEALTADTGRTIGAWVPAIVPGTVLTTLVHNGIFPEPLYGLNNLEVPDIFHAGREFYTYWFRTVFQWPYNARLLKADSRFWLHFRGINYSAEVFLNGKQVPLEQPRGMFLRRALDVTALAEKRKENRLVVLVHPPDHPGCVDVPGQGADHQIAHDVAAQYVEGWDWICPVRDRNTGIWDQVDVEITGPVAIRNPHVVTRFHDKDCTRAVLCVSAELVNNSDRDWKGTVHLSVTRKEGGFCSVERLHTASVQVEASSANEHLLAQLDFDRPELWWPNGLGAPALYDLSLDLVLDGYGDSDSSEVRFGFRHVTSYIDPKLQGRRFEVNGRPVFIRGGNWIVSDAMLRLSKERYEEEMRFHAEMGLNMVRVWGGALAERPEFYAACDEHGLLVWQEFWITGDCNGRGVPPSEASWPDDHSLFLECARDTVKLLRNSPSLALWVGGNEQIPPPDINEALEKELRLDDGSGPVGLLDGTRQYFCGSLWEGFAKGDGAFRDGPYTIQEPSRFFEDDFYPYAFNPEIGNVGVPVAETIRATMDEAHWAPPTFHTLDDGSIVETPNECWDYHTYIPYSQAGVVRNQIALYGIPTTLDAFCDQAQLVNFVQYRALLEAWNARMWRRYSGLLIWKTQNPWPGLRGQLYDCQLDQTAGFFGVKSACEPVHVQLDLHSRDVQVINTTFSDVDAIVSATIYNMDGAIIRRLERGRALFPADSASVSFRLREETELDVPPVYFVLLELKRPEGGKVLSRNFYWLSRNNGDFRALQGGWRRRHVDVHVLVSGRFVPLQSGGSQRSERKVTRFGGNGPGPEVSGMDAEGSGTGVGGNYEVLIEISNGADVRGEVSSLTDGCASELEDRRAGVRLVGVEKGQADAGQESWKHQSAVMSDVMSSGQCDERPDVRCREGRLEKDVSASGVAFWLHIGVLKSSEGVGVGPSDSKYLDPRVSPVHYSDNYFSLVPGEKRLITVEFTRRLEKVNEHPSILIEGWNVQRRVFELKARR
ncbi:glycoside hydrolase family 2 protein [Klebsormidium nitens]|uniref:Glycoside hydrolase family 2 protein n=1 Tax=Klebsormidium nitens TaxID=105231 RepID=A0A1Y1ICU2_KLENI|nr:glycoside hydrolase family 2 protein [Klebsormidium nitens]|eukprot:GAQ88413.1 glycoside hydrolase family 2 protein [Klebsormidium nitens]